MRPISFRPAKGELSVHYDLCDKVSESAPRGRKIILARGYELTVCFHIGLPKTGTTVLQQYFKRVDELSLVYRGANDPDNICRGTRSYVHGKRYLRPTKMIRAAAKALAARAAEGRRSGQILMITDENTSIKGTDVWDRKGTLPNNCAARLHKFVRGFAGIDDDVFVLIGIREPGSWLASRFVQSRRNLMERAPDRAGMFSQECFDGFLEEIARGAPLPPSLHWLNYNLVQEAFVDRFGAENVLFQPQEKLGSDPDGTLDRLQAFLGCDDLKLPHYPFRQRNVKRVDESNWKIKGFNLHLDPQLRCRVNRRFAEFSGPYSDWL